METKNFVFCFAFRSPCTIFVPKKKKMPIIPITSLQHPGVEIFSTLTEAQLRNRIEPTKGIFIAESPKVINVALGAGYEPVALLCEQKHIDGDAASIISAHPDMPVYTGSRELLATLTGYTLTRGVLCAMRRPIPPTVEEVCRDARRVVVIDGVVDTTNIGAIFRSAAALGIDAVDDQAHGEALPLPIPDPGPDFIDFGCNDQVHTAPPCITRTGFRTGRPMVWSRWVRTGSGQSLFT